MAGSSQTQGWQARCACLIAILVVLLLVVLAGPWAGRWARRREPFFTRYAVEEPTRSYVPYTGELPYGEWGARPWAMVDFPPAGDARCPDLGPGFDGVQTPPVSADHPLSWNARRHAAGIPY